MNTQPDVAESVRVSYKMVGGTNRSIFLLCSMGLNCASIKGVVFIYKINNIRKEIGNPSST